MPEPYTRTDTYYRFNWHVVTSGGIHVEIKDCGLPIVDDGYVRFEDFDTDDNEHMRAMFFQPASIIRGSITHPGVAKGDLELADAEVQGHG